MKKAVAIELHDAEFYLSTKEHGSHAVWTDFGDHNVYRLYGTDLARAAEIFGITPPDRVYTGYYNKDLRPRAEATVDVEIALKRAYHEDDPGGWQEVGELLAEVVAPGLLEIKATWNQGTEDQWSVHLTYSGSFSVQWDEEEQ